MCATCQPNLPFDDTPGPDFRFSSEKGARGVAFLLQRLPILLDPGWKLKLSALSTVPAAEVGAEVAGYRPCRPAGKEVVKGFGTSKGEAGSSFLLPPLYAVPFTAQCTSCQCLLLQGAWYGD